MKLLNLLTARNLKLNKNRTIVTIIGIMLSVALLTAVICMFFAARESLIAYEIDKNGEYHYAFFDVPEEDVEEIALNRKVETLYTKKDLGYAVLDGVKNPDKPYAYITAMSQDSMEHLGITLLKGRLPKSPDEILVPSHVRTNGRVTLTVGDTLSFQVGTRVLTADGEVLDQSNPYQGDESESIIETEQKDYTVVGIIERMSTEMEAYTAPGYTFVTFGEADQLAGNQDVFVKYTKEGLKDVYGVTAGILGVDAEAFRMVNTNEIMEQPETVIDELFAKISEEKYEYRSNAYLIQLETGLIKNNTLASFASACVLVCVIIIFTSVFCIKNSFDISIGEKIRQYGMLSSVGATGKQIRKNVFFEAFLLGVIGIPLGLLLGHLATAILLVISNRMLADMLAFQLVFAFSWYAVLLAVVLGFVTLFFSAKRSAKKASRISPIQAIRNSDDLKNSNKAVRTPKWICRIFGIGGEIAHKNLQRSKKKYRTTVVSIVICVTVFVAMSSFVNLGFGMIKAEIDASDYNLSIGCAGTKETLEEVDQVWQLEGIRQMSSCNSTQISCQNYDYTKKYLELVPDANETYEDEDGQMQAVYAAYMNLYLLDDITFQSYVEDTLHLDYEAVREKGILLNDIIEAVEVEDGTYKDMEVEKYAYQKGDIIKAVFDETEDAIEIPIAAVAKEVPFGLYVGYVPTVLVSESYADLVFAHAPYQYIFIDASDASQVQDQLEIIFGDETYNISNVEENAKAIQSLITLVGIFLYGLIIVISLISVTNIFNTITTNMNLRKREFAMLQSVGMTKREFNRMIQLESLFYGTKALVIGLPIGCVLSYVIYRVMSEGDMILRYHLPIRAMLLAVAAVFLLITCIMRYSVRRISKQNIIETIRNENI